MKKIIKSVLLSLFVTLLAVGIVYAYTVRTRTTTTNLEEAISTEWVKQLPGTTYSNQTYVTQIQITNIDAVENGDQNVGVKVSTTNLENLDVWVEDYGWGYKFDDLITFTMAKGTTTDIKAKVKVDSTEDPINTPTVVFIVTRE